MAGIGKKMEENPQIQEFVERVLGYVFNQLVNGEISIEDVLDGLMDITEEEAYWIFEQLGYNIDEYMRRGE